jgi:hypothetical protein
MFVNWTDDVSLSSYIFSWNGTDGIWRNDTAVGFSGLAGISNVTKTINLTRGKTIGWKIHANDSTNTWNVSSVYTFVVENTPPQAVNLSLPLNGTTIINRNPFLNWTPAYDVDNDAINYTLVISEAIGCTNFGLECILADYQKTQITTNSYTLTDLDLGLDTWYNWTVRAYDGENYSEWAYYYNFTVSGVVSITLGCTDCNNVVEFGSVLIGLSYNTTNNTAAPLIFENDGNVFVDVQINASPLWDAVGHDDVYYRFAAGNASETPSFNYTNSTTVFTNMSAYQKDVVRGMNYSNATDLAEIELLIRVPNDESAGDKESFINLEARYYNAS